MYHIRKLRSFSVSGQDRTHYDKIGLLVAKSENGYRTYSQEDLERLQVSVQIPRFFFRKYLGKLLKKGQICPI